MSGGDVNMATSSINHQIVLSTTDEVTQFENAINESLAFNDSIEERFIVSFDHSAPDCPCCCIRYGNNIVRFLYNDEARQLYEILSGKEV